MKKMAIFLLAAALLAGGWWVRISYAASLPGSPADPAVTKTYVDDKFNTLQTQISQILTRLNAISSTQAAAVPTAAPVTLPGATPSIALPDSSGLPAADDSEIVSDVVAQIEYLYGDVLKGSAQNAAQSASATPAADSGSSFVPVSAAAGQIIVGGEGTEIILRSGAAVGYTSVADGIVNASVGADIKNGQAIKTNQLHIVPRADGRGVRVTQDAWFIIKGSYQVID